MLTSIMTSRVCDTALPPSIDDTMAVEAGILHARYCGNSPGAGPSAAERFQSGSIEVRTLSRKAK